MSTFAELGLLPELLRAVNEQGYTEPTPIQAQAIPVILAGRDVMGGAQTGTGKTAGFALPTLQRFAPLASTSTSPARHPVRALILAPTRELAVQVEESFREYGKYVPLRTAVIYGVRRYTWAESYARMRRLASALTNAGLGLGDTVSVIAANTPEIFEAHFGVDRKSTRLNSSHSSVSRMPSSA